MSDVITYNDARGRYEMRVDGGLTVYARVRREGDVVYIDFVEAPPELRGTGAAGKFMDKLMQLIRAEDRKAVPVCGYAATWLQRHPEYQDLVKR